jgi:hypothetical protein
VSSTTEQERRALKNIDPTVVEFLRKRLRAHRAAATKIGEQNWLLRQTQGRAQEIQTLLEFMGKSEDGE